MTEADVRAALASALRMIAPEADISHVDAEADYRLVLGLDSFDFLRLMQSFHAATGIDVIEDAYPKAVSVRGLTDYVRSVKATSS
ncbi:MAG: acyl carrier protein [Candidatus Kapabacteria bacterium]|nr:acyl carrier protein [Candidatus Kapabacteria bacterium]